MKEHKAKEFFGSASKDYEGLLHKTGGDLRLVAVPDIDIGKLAKAIQGNKKNLKIRLRPETEQRRWRQQFFW